MLQGLKRIQSGTLGDPRNQSYSHSFPFGSRLEELGYHQLFQKVEICFLLVHYLLACVASTDSHTTARLPLVMTRRSLCPRQQGFLLIST